MRRRWAILFGLGLPWLNFGFDDVLVKTQCLRLNSAHDFTVKFDARSLPTVQDRKGHFTIDVPVEVSVKHTLTSNSGTVVTTITDGRKRMIVSGYGTDPSGQKLYSLHLDCDPAFKDSCLPDGKVAGYLWDKRKSLKLTLFNFQTFASRNGALIYMDSVSSRFNLSASAAAEGNLDGPAIAGVDTEDEGHGLCKIDQLKNLALTLNNLFDRLDPIHP